MADEAQPWLKQIPSGEQIQLTFPIHDVHTAVAALGGAASVAGFACPKQLLARRHWGVPVALCEDGVAWTEGTRKTVQSSSIRLLVRPSRSVMAHTADKAVEQPSIRISSADGETDGTAVCQLANTTEFSMLRDTTLPSMWKPPAVSAAALITAIDESADPLRSSHMLPANFVALQRSHGQEEAAAACKNLGIAGPFADAASSKRALATAVAASTQATIRQRGTLPELAHPMSASHTITKPPMMSRQLLSHSAALAVLEHAASKGISVDEHENDSDQATNDSASGSTLALAATGIGTPEAASRFKAWSDCRDLASIDVVKPGALRAAFSRLQPRLDALPRFRASLASLPREGVAAMLVAAALFRVRPVWPFSVLCSVIGKRNAVNHGILFSALGMRVRSGTFKGCIIRHGTDPTSCSSFVAYQLIEKAGGKQAETNGHSAVQRRHAVTEALRTVLEHHRQASAAEFAPPQASSATETAPMADTISATSAAGISEVFAIPQPERRRRRALAAVECVPGALIGAVCTCHTDTDTSVVVRHRATLQLVDVACEMLGAPPALPPAAATAANPGRVSLSALVYGTNQAVAAASSSSSSSSSSQVSKPFGSFHPDGAMFTEAELWDAIAIGHRRFRALLWTSGQPVVDKCKEVLAGTTWQEGELGWMHSNAHASVNAYLPLLLGVSRTMFKAEAARSDLATRYADSTTTAVSTKNADLSDLEAGLVKLPSLSRRLLPPIVTPITIAARAATRRRRRKPTKNERTAAATAAAEVVSSSKRSRPAAVDAASIAELPAAIAMPRIAPELGSPATFSASLSATTNEALRNLGASALPRPKGKPETAFQ